MAPAKDAVPMGAQALRVVVIGGGFSGTLVATHLLRQNSFVQVDMVEPRLPGRGLAYSTFYDEHLLNVPAVRMSAFGSEPLHFLEWLHAHGNPAADSGMFAPRKLFGSYIQDLLEKTARSSDSNARFRHHLTQAMRIAFDGTSVNVFLQNGESLRADKVVLASGNPAPRPMGTVLPGYFASPWQANALSDLPSHAAVLLIGAGLTAVDAFLGLLSQGHAGKIYIVSRRGKLPEVHAPYRPLPDAFCAQGIGSARELLRSIRNEARAAEARGLDWRAVIDSIRPVTNDIWQQLGPKEQQRVFRHLKTWWDIHRHRMAPEIGVKVSDALARGQLAVHAGRLGGLSESGAGLKADIRLRDGESIRLLVERAINCTGPDNDYRATENTLIRSLLDNGYAVPGSTNRGLKTTPQGELIDRHGTVLEWLLALGPPRFGDLFETIAVPELRKQAEALANRLLSILREPIEVMPELYIAAGI